MYPIGLVHDRRGDVLKVANTRANTTLFMVVDFVFSLCLIDKHNKIVIVVIVIIIIT